MKLILERGMALLVHSGRNGREFYSRPSVFPTHMSFSLNSLEGLHTGLYRDYSKGYQAGY